MTKPAQNVAKLRPLQSRDDPEQGYTIAHRVYDISKGSLADYSLEPRDSLPNNQQQRSDSDFVIFRSRIGKPKGETTEMAIVTAAKGSFKVVTISCTLTQSTTTVTLVSGGPFYPQMVGTVIDITGANDVTVTGYTSPSVVTVGAGDSQTFGPTAKDATFPNSGTELAISRDYRGSKSLFWWSEKNFLEAKADTASLVAELWNSYFIFNANFPSGYAQRITVLDEDPRVLTKSRIRVEYRTSYNPKQYPIGKATQEMYTSGDNKKLLYDLSALSGTATQSGTTVTLVSGNIAFRPAHVGSILTLTGAGTPTTKITAYTSATEITVADTQTEASALPASIPARPIETKPDKDGYYYVVETGTNIVPDPRPIFVIRTALARSGGGSLDYLTVAGFAGYGNSKSFSKIGGGIPKHHALCMKVGVAPDYIDDGSDAYVPVMFMFGYYDMQTYSCVVTQSGTTLTRVSGDPFVPGMVGKTVSISGETDVVVTAFTNATTVTVTPSQTIASGTKASFSLLDLDDWCTARRRRRWAKKEAVLHIDDDPQSQTRTWEKPDGSTTNTESEAKTRTVLKDEWAQADDAAGGVENKVRDCILYKDFSTIDALLTWGP